MKEIKHYVCEVCGTEYSEKLNATTCEGNHKKIKCIKKCKYRSMRDDKTGMPLKIEVEMETGEIVAYSR